MRRKRLERKEKWWKEKNERGKGKERGKKRKREIVEKER